MEKYWLASGEFHSSLFILTRHTSQTAHAEHANTVIKYTQTEYEYKRINSGKNMYINAKLFVH